MKRRKTARIDKFSSADHVRSAGPANWWQCAEKCRKDRRGMAHIWLHPKRARRRRVRKLAGG